MQTINQKAKIISKGSRIIPKLKNHKLKNINIFKPFSNRMALFIDKNKNQLVKKFFKLTTFYKNLHIVLYGGVFPRTKNETGN